MSEVLQKLAKQLDAAAFHAKPIQQLTKNHRLSLDDAYAIERLLIHERISRGASVAGIKMGFTSVAKMEQMGVHDMIWGILTDDMKIENGGEVALTKFIHPRAEPEICFRASKDISHEIPLEELDHYVDAMAPAIEVIDSRYENFKFTLEDVVADNCSSAGFVVGEWQSPSHNIANLSMQQFFDDEVVAEGSTSAILSDPWNALQAATRLIGQYGYEVKKGQTILAGAATAAVFLKKGVSVKVKVEGMSPLHFNVV